MKSYRPDWDLSTIPEEAWASERGRRNRAMQPKGMNVKLRPCKGCKRPLSAVERRKRCPDCGTVNTKRDKEGNWIDS